MPTRMPAWLRALWPEPPTVTPAEQWRAVAGTVLAVLLTGLLGQALHLSDGHSWLLPPLGASAVLLMAMPSSPFTQPWSVVAGNGVSALIGLAAYHQVIDLDRDDLQALLHDAQAHAYQRTLGQLRCSDIMSTALVTVGGAQTLSQAWARLLEHRIKALPVVDAAGHVVGIITRADFIAHWHGEPQDKGPHNDDTPVRRLMSRQVRVASDSTRVIELLPLFSQGGHHHLPIVDDAHVLVGMVTESDVVRALHRALS